MFVTSSGSSRSRIVQAATDPVVVGLGRLLVGVGIVTLAGVLAVAWLIWQLLGTL